MPKVKKQTASKIGLFSAIMVIFGAVVGIGIFFKNKTVFQLNDANSIGVIVSWIISIVLVLCMALSFAELSSCKMKNRNAGLGGWAQQFCGHKFGRFAKTGYTLLFYPVNTFAIMFFTGEACLNCFADLGINGSRAGGFNFGSGTTAYVFMVGMALFATFMVLNMLASKGMGKFGNIVGLVKFAPIAMVIFLGIIFGVMYGQSGIWTGHWMDDPKGTGMAGALNPMGIISSIPAILFAYEGYLAIGSIAGDMEKPEKNVPLAVVLGVAIISVLYLAITIGCMTAGSGNVYHLMSLLATVSPDGARALTLIMSIFIFICLIGTTNAMSFAGIRGFQALCEDGTLFKGKALVNKKPGNKLFGGFVYFFVVLGLWWLAIMIPSSIMNTDAIADGSSTVMVVFLYLIYGLTILGGFINRFTKKHEVIKVKVFPVAAVIGILASFFVFAFVGFYQFLAKPISDISTGISWTTPYAGAGWGMFVAGAPTITYLEAISWFWGMFAVMIAFPFINDLFIKWWDKSNKQRLIWQKADNSKVLN